MALIAWYRPYNAIEDTKDYGKDTNPSNLITKTTNNNITYYSLQNDFSSALKSAGDLTLSVVLALPESVDFVGFRGIASVASGRILGLYREEGEGVYPAFVYCDRNNKSNYLISTTPLELEETSYVTSVQTSDRITIYVNGELAAEAKVNLNAGYALPSYMLNDVRHLQDGALNSIEGIEWGDLRVYDEALSEGEVKAIYAMATFGKANYDSVFRGALIEEGADTGKIDIASNTLIMKDVTGSWRTLDPTYDYKSDSPVYFYRGPNHPDPDTEGIKDGFLISRGPADLRKALIGDYNSFFEYSGPIYLNFATSGVGLVRYAGFSYTPGDNNILLGAVAEDHLRRYSIVNLNIGRSATSQREFNSDFFRGVVTSELDMPTRPWNVGDYIVAGDDVDAFELVKGNAYTYNGTNWVVIEANGTNGSKLQELLGILLEAGVDLDDISSANTVSWFNTIVANAIYVGHLTLVITQYGFSTSNTVEPQVWSPTLDLSEDGQYMEVTWGNSYITWEDRIIRFVIAEGGFLWTRTSSDNGRTWQVHCVTGESGASVESITPLYYYTSGSIPSRPTQPVTSTSKAANQWTRVLPDSINSSYKYYTCSEIEFDSVNAGSNGFTWSEVIEDTIASQAGYSYYQFTAADGLFQSIQGRIETISGSYVESDMEARPGEIILKVTKSKGATEKTIVGGIIIAIDNNGQPYIKLDGNADITGALTTVDVYSKSLRDYADSRGQPVTAYTGRKFLPSDLGHGYALSDNDGTLQANEAYLDRMVAKDASLTGTFATSNFMAGTEGVSLSITPTTSGSYKCIKREDLAGIGPNCAVAFTSGSVTFTSGQGPYGISSVSASSALPIYVEWHEATGSFSSLRVKAFVSLLNNYVSVWGGTLDEASGMFLGDSTAYNTLTGLSLSGALSAVGVSNLIPRDPPNQNYAFQWGYFNNTKSRYTSSTIGTSDNRYKTIYSYCSDNAYAYNFFTTGELVATDYIVLGSRIRINPDNKTVSYENTYGGTSRIHNSAYGMFCEFNEGDMGQTSNIKRAFNVVQANLDHDGGDAMTNPDSNMSIEANINLPRFNHATTTCKVYGAVFN